MGCSKVIAHVNFSNVTCAVNWLQHINITWVQGARYLNTSLRRTTFTQLAKDEGGLHFNSQCSQCLHYVKYENSNCVRNKSGKCWFVERKTVRVVSKKPWATARVAVTNQACFGTQSLQPSWWASWPSSLKNPLYSANGTSKSDTSVFMRIEKVKMGSRTRISVWWYWAGMRRRLTASTPILSQSSKCVGLSNILFFNTTIAFFF